MVANDFKVKNGFVQLQRALHDPSRGIRALSSETICHLKNYIFIHILTTNARLALALRCPCVSLLRYIGKVKVG